MSVPFVLPSSRSGLKHPLFRPIPSHSIRICLSYYPPIPRLFPFDQSSSNAIASDCIERLAFNEGSGTMWGREQEGGSEKEQRSICTGFFSLSSRPDFYGSKEKKKKERKKKTNLSPILPTETSLLVCLRDRFCFPPLLFESEASAFLAKFLLLYANYSALWFSLFLPPPSSLSFRDVTKVTCVILLKGARNRARRLKARRVLQGIDLKHFDYVRTRTRCNLPEIRYSTYGYIGNIAQFRKSRYTHLCIFILNPCLRAGYVVICAVEII